MTCPIEFILYVYQKTNSK